MAHKVFISSHMSQDEDISDIADVNQLAALMWPWILTCFDDWGRAKASPREIKNSVFPANDLITVDVIKNALNLYNGRLINLYEVEGKPYMYIDPDKWFKYQTHIRSEKRDNDKSKHPAPNAESSAKVREGARNNAQIADNLTNCTPSPSPSPSPSLSPSIAAVVKEPFVEIMEAFCELHKKGEWNLKDNERKSIYGLLEKSIPPEYVIRTMNQIHKKKTTEGETITSFAFYFNQIVEAWEGEKKNEELKGRLKGIRPGRNQTTSSRSETESFVSKSRWDDTDIQMPKVSG